MAKVMCVRITYLGELGYELYIPTEHSLHVYDLLVSVGQRVGLRHAGLKARFREAVAQNRTGGEKAYFLHAVSCP
jgi:glycine cleavage system aminomethyltransferase T